MMSLVLRLPRDIHLSRSSPHVPRLPSFLDMLQNPHVLLTFGKVQNPLHLPGKKPHLNLQKWSEHLVLCTFWLGNVLRATTASTFSTSQLPKVLRSWCALYILTWKCALGHSGVHFSASQLPKVLRRWCALYILTWKCASGHSGVHFSTSQLPKVLRRWCALYILTWKRASRHSGVHFFDIATSKSAPTLVCFVRSFDFVLHGTTACTYSTSQLPKVLRTWGAFYVLTWGVWSCSDSLSAAPKQITPQASPPETMATLWVRKGTTCFICLGRQKVSLTIHEIIWNHMKFHQKQVDP